MFNYFTINELFINLIFPLITAVTPLILTYLLFEPLVGLIKKLDISCISMYDNQGMTI